MDESTYGPIRALLERSAVDDDLCRELLADPKGAIERHCGIELPVDWAFEPSLAADGSVALSFVGAELPDILLDSVAGGAPSPVTFRP